MHDIRDIDVYDIKTGQRDPDYGRSLRWAVYVLWAVCGAVVLAAVFAVFAAWRWRVG